MFSIILSDKVPPRIGRQKKMCVSDNPTLSPKTWPTLGLLSNVCDVVVVVANLSFEEEKNVSNGIQKLKN